jgi:hypothetical protein
MDFGEMQRPLMQRAAFLVMGRGPLVICHSSFGGSGRGISAARSLHIDWRAARIWQIRAARRSAKWERHRKIGENILDL